MLQPAGKKYLHSMMKWTKNCNIQIQNPRQR